MTAKAASEDARWQAARPFVAAVIRLWNETAHTDGSSGEEFGRRRCRSQLDAAISMLGTLAATFTKAEINAMGEIGEALRGGREVDTALEATRQWCAPVDETLHVIDSRWPRRNAVAQPSGCLTPGSTWTSPDGTIYDVVRPEEIRDRPRWWIPVNCAPEAVGMNRPGDLHDSRPLTDGSCDLALVLHVEFDEANRLGDDNRRAFASRTREMERVTQDEARTPVGNHDIKPANLTLAPSSTWTGSDGTVYDVVSPDKVGVRRRWWIVKGALADFAQTVRDGFGQLAWKPGPLSPDDLHVNPIDDEDAVTVLALVLPRESPSSKILTIHQLKELCRTAADADVVRASIVALGDAHYVLEQAPLNEEREQAHALCLQAWAARSTKNVTATTITTDQIHELRNTSVTSNPIFAWCAEALAGSMTARALCAAVWNARQNAGTQ